MNYGREKSHVYVCENCCHQTFGAIGECPDCGRKDFAEFDLSADHNGANHRQKWTSSDKSGVAAFLLITGITFFVAAFLSFFEFGTSKHNRTLIVLMFVAFGIGSMIAGIVLKSGNSMP